MLVRLNYHETFSTAILLLPLIQEGLLSYVYEELVNSLVKLAQIMWITDRLDMNIAVGCDVKPQTN